jgi:hypothetical protein
VIAVSEYVNSAEAIARVLLGLGAALTPVGVMFGAFWARDSRKHSKEANDAVNRVHQAGGERIYDMVMSTQKNVEKGFIKSSQQHALVQEQIEGMAQELTQNRRHVIKMWYELFPDNDYDELDFDGEELAG